MTARHRFITGLRESCRNPIQWSDLFPTYTQARIEQVCQCLEAAILEDYTESELIEVSRRESAARRLALAVSTSLTASETVFRDCLRRPCR